jgi:hypothetical protein
VSPRQQSKPSHAAKHSAPVAKADPINIPATPPAKAQPARPPIKGTAPIDRDPLYGQRAGRRAPLSSDLAAQLWWQKQRASHLTGSNARAPHRAIVESEVQKAQTPLLLTSVAPQPEVPDSQSTHNVGKKFAPLLPELDSIVFVQRSTNSAEELPRRARQRIQGPTQQSSPSYTQVAAVCDDVFSSAEAARTSNRIAPAPSTRQPPIVLVQAQEVYEFPDPSAVEQWQAPDQTFAGTSSAAAVEVIDDPEIDERIRGLSIDIRPRRSLGIGGADGFAPGQGDLITKADLPGESKAALDSSQAYVQSAGPASPTRTTNYREYVWAAPNFYHRPLYFEQKNLERYGYHYGGVCTQSAVSAAHFFATIPVLPYKITMHKPHECDYTLGHYRPGNCAPNRLTRCKFDLNALAVEGVVATGCALILY